MKNNKMCTLKHYSVQQIQINPENAKTHNLALEKHLKFFLLTGDTLPFAYTLRYHFGLMFNSQLNGWMISYYTITRFKKQSGL